MATEIKATKDSNTDKESGNGNPDGRGRAPLRENKHFAAVLMAAFLTEPFKGFDSRAHAIKHAIGEMGGKIRIGCPLKDGYVELDHNDRMELSTLPDTTAARSFAAPYEYIMDNSERVIETLSPIVAGVTARAGVKVVSAEEADAALAALFGEETESDDESAMQEN